MSKDVGETLLDDRRTGENPWLKILPFSTLQRRSAGGQKVVDNMCDVW